MRPESLEIIEDHPRPEGESTVSLGLAIGFALLSFLNISVTYAQDNNTELAKQTQNPVADLISIPFQNNMNFGLEPNHRMQNVLNIQPVIPFHLTDDWNLITRTIAPIIKQPTLSTSDDDTWGLGDINFSAFFSPAKSGSLIWGVGPVMLLPTGTDEVLSSRKWGIGPTAVGLTIQGPWVVGMLINNIWSIAGNDDRGDVSRGLLQYFINYNLPDGWYLTSAPILTANWEARSGNKYIVPVGGGIGKIVRIGRLPLNCSLAAFANVVRPDPGPDWTLRAQIQFILPKTLFQNP